ncbi:hypothetical protein [Nostoc sp.]|uniref:hypothetical protein n=1 Tax=Nostoc sp. TaxID=1180 RepID=UPI002FF67272
MDEVGDIILYGNAGKGIQKAKCQVDYLSANHHFLTSKWLLSDATIIPHQVLQLLGRCDFSTLTLVSEA